jgi:hypothetical protein
MTSTAVNDFEIEATQNAVSRGALDRPAGLPVAAQPLHVDDAAEVKLARCGVDGRRYGGSREEREEHANGLACRPPASYVPFFSSVRINFAIAFSVS